jgi:DNA-binding SARP family transcriptional activator
MMPNSIEHNPSFSENDNFAPCLVPGQYLPRKGLLNSILSRGAAQKKWISIEAQAGQGKSHFAAQYLAHIGIPFSWYQVGSKSADPVVFIKKIVDSLRSTLPGISFPLLQKLIKNDDLSPFEPDRFAEILASDIGRSLHSVHYLVFDDIHLLEGSPASLQFLRSLIAAAPHRLRFIVISRRAIFSELVLDGRLHIANEDLSLSRNEVSELCVSLLQIPATSDTVRVLQKASEGWIMGVLLAGKSLAGAGINGISQRLQALDAKEEVDILSYFQKEVLSFLPDSIRLTLLKLSLLELIPVSLAQLVAPAHDIRKDLEQYGYQNLFMRQVDESGNTFVFHHLFRDSLRSSSERELSPDARREVFRLAADWYRGRGQTEEALDYYLQAEDYTTAQALLHDVGAVLLASNRLVTLQGALARLPEAILEGSAWLSFFYGVTLLESDHPKAYRSLKGANESFAAQGDTLGELLSATHLLNYHCLVDGLLKSGGPFLDRADKLYAQLEENLNVSARFHIAQILSQGATYIAADSLRAKRYAAIALRMAEESGHDNFVFGATLCEIYLYAFQGDWERTRIAVENLTALSSRPSVSVMNRATFRILQLNLLAMEGDFESYLSLKDVLFTGSIKGISERTIFAPFLLVWDIDTSIAAGDIDAAAKSVNEALRLGGAASGPHMRSQYLHYQAYLFALQGKKEEALSAAEKSRQLRTDAGGGYFVALNSMILGATYAQLQLPELAEPLLQSAIDFSTETGNGFNRAAAHAHRAYLRLATGDQSGGLDDLRQMLRSLKEKDYVHFFSWTPRIVEGLLRVAVDHGIEVDYARRLYRQRLGQALLSDGSTLPLLKIKTLGSLRLELDGVASITVGQLTPGQRDLLAMLIAAPECGLSLGEIQLALWPESSTQKARSTFDNLLSRLRKVLDETLGGQVSKAYLSLEKGFLRLRYCQIDTARFQERVQAGFQHLKHKKFWQAGNALRSAHHLWGGEFIPSVQSADSVNDFRHDLLNRYLECARHLPGILLSHGLRDEALKVAEEALRYDRTNEVLIRWIYNLYTQNGDLVKARRTILQYEEMLAKDGHSPPEIEEVLEGFWAGAV